MVSDSGPGTPSWAAAGVRPVWARKSGDLSKSCSKERNGFRQGSWDPPPGQPQGPALARLGKVEILVRVVVKSAMVSDRGPGTPSWGIHSPSQPFLHRCRRRSPRGSAPNTFSSMAHESHFGIDADANPLENLLRTPLAPWPIVAIFASMLAQIPPRICSELLCFIPSVAIVASMSTQIPPRICYEHLLFHGL